MQELNSRLVVYTDGGVLGRNPSRHGGTWAFCVVRDEQIVLERSGLIQPDSGLKTISNNVAELFAAWQALCWMSPHVPFVLWTDSRVTQLRLTDSYRFAGVPDWLRQKVLRLRLLLRYTVTLGAGHPTKKELAQGVRERNSLPTSKWNVWCDEECQRLARKFFAQSKTNERPHR